MQLNHTISKMIRTSSFDLAEELIGNALLDPEISPLGKIELDLFQSQILFKKGFYAKVINKIEETLELCKQIENVSLNFKCHFIISNSSTRIGEFDKTAYHLNQMKKQMALIQINFPTLYNDFLSDLNFIKALNERYQSNFNLAIELYNRCIEIRNENGDNYGTAEPRNHLGIIYDNLGDHKSAVAEYNLAIKIYTAFNDKLALLGVMSNLGLLYWQVGELNKSREIFISALEKVNENPNFERMKPLLVNIGLVSIDLGRLSDAKNYFVEAQVYFEKVDDKRGLILSLMNLGIIHDLLWEFDIAIRYFYNAVELSEKIGNKDHLLKLYINLGITHKNQNKLELALRYFKKALDLNEYIKSELGQSKILYLLADTYLHLERIKEANIMQEQLRNLSENSDNIVINRTIRLLDGIELKSRSGLANRAKASEIFSTLIREDAVSYEIAMSAIVNLCEILVTEVQITKNEGDLKEIEFLLNKMELLSGENPSSIVKINILLMKSRIAFMLEKIDEAVGLLENATNIAEIQNIKYLTNRVHDERNYLESQALSMQQVGGMASMKLDLINKRNDDYIDFLKKNFKNVIHSK